MSGAMSDLSEFLLILAPIALYASAIGLAIIVIIIVFAGMFAVIDGGDEDED